MAASRPWRTASSTPGPRRSASSANCVTLEARTRAVLAELGEDATTENVTDTTQIVGYGVMSTPVWSSTRLERASAGADDETRTRNPAPSAAVPRRRPRTCVDLRLRRRSSRDRRVGRAVCGVELRSETRATAPAAAQRRGHRVGKRRPQRAPARTSSTVHVLPKCSAMQVSAGPDLRPNSWLCTTSSSYVTSIERVVYTVPSATSHQL
jgi:hypothetical protein